MSSTCIRWGCFHGFSLWWGAVGSFSCLTERKLHNVFLSYLNVVTDSVHRNGHGEGQEDPARSGKVRTLPNVLGSPGPPGLPDGHPQSSLSIHRTYLFWSLSRKLATAGANTGGTNGTLET
jgi:hypothetical protein